MDIASRIVDLRKERGYSTTKLARMAGIAQSTLREIEIGKTSPTWDTIMKVCQALGIGVATLVADPAADYGYPPGGEGELGETPAGYDHGDDPQNLVYAARLLTPRQRRLLLLIMDELARSKRL